MALQECETYIGMVVRHQAVADTVYDDADGLAVQSANAQMRTPNASKTYLLDEAILPDLRTVARADEPRRVTSTLADTHVNLFMRVPFAIHLRDHPRGETDAA